MQDQQPAAKVIDFGVAKAINQRLTEQTLVTGFAQMLGTPLYMSSEQAEMSPMDVDTRSDVYSLGVLLYELLTGTTPFDKERLRNAGYDELCRIIRHEEPPPPSSRLSTLGDLAPTIAEQRRTDPRKLHQTVRGDLDWIVLKALEKDRTRRYETASAFATDFKRFLSDEPIEARPPSAGYRFAKFVRRNKVALITASIVLATVIVGLVIGGVLIAEEQARTMQALGQAQSNLTEAERLREVAERNLQLAEEQRRRAEANLEKALEAVDRMLTRVADETLGNVPQMGPVRRALLEDALEFYQVFLKQSSDNPDVRLGAAQAWLRVGWVHNDLGAAPAEIRRAQEESINLLEKLVAEAPDEPKYRRELAWAYNQGAHTLLWRLNDTQAAEESVRAAVNLQERIIEESSDGPGDLDSLANFLDMLGRVWEQSDRLGEAEEAYRRAITYYERAASESGPDNGNQCAQGAALGSLGQVLFKINRIEEAEAAYREGLALAESFDAQGPTSYETCCLRSGLANLLAATGHHQEAEVLYTQTISAWEEKVTDFPDQPLFGIQRAATSKELGRLLVSQNRGSEAEEAFRQAMAQLEESAALRSAPDFPFVVIEAQFGLVELLIEAGRFDEVQRICQRVIEVHDPASALGWYAQALVQLATDDLDGYHETCAAMLERFGQTEDRPTAYWVAWTCSLSANADQDLRLAVRLAEQTVQEQPGNGQYVNALGAILVRAGWFEEAVTHLSELSAGWERGGETPHHFSPAYNWFFLAIACHHLDRPDEAERWYQKADAWAKNELGDQRQGGKLLHLQPWNRRVTLKFLQREDAELLHVDD